MLNKPLRGESRSLEQLQQDYEVEKDLAGKLRNASRQERQSLYSSVYDEYFERVQYAPQLLRKSSPELTATSVSRQMSFLRRYLNEDKVFLEVGPGDCSLAVAVSKCVKQVFAVDVSSCISKGGKLPNNCEHIISDGSNIPVPEGSVDIVYSNQLMEHLHPDDAFEQLQSIYNSLAPGGCYICATPNRLSGPHDISKYFDEVATGFHLKEYSVSELLKLFEKAGFKRCASYIGKRGFYIKVPIGLQAFLERIVAMFPAGVRALARINPIKGLLGIRLVGQK